MADAETLLVLRAQAGDRQAVEDLLSGVQGPLRRYVGRLLGPQRAEDALQETLIRIYRKLPWLDAPELFRPWAYRIASREALRLAQRDRRWRDHVQTTEDVEELAVSVPASLPEIDASDAGRLLERLSPASRAVLLLHYGEHMTIEGTAAVLGIAVGTAKSRLSYGLRTLRRAATAHD